MSDTSRTSTELPEVYVCIEDHQYGLDKSSSHQVIIRARGETSEKAFENFLKLKAEADKK
jgi:hypothetical protein